MSLTRVGHRVPAPARAAFAIVVAAAVACAVVGCAASPSASGAARSSAAQMLTDLGPRADQPFDGTVALLRVNGMSCPKCVSNIDVTLRKLPSVDDIAINMRDGVVRVTFREGERPSYRQLIQAVEDAGLTLVSLERSA